MKEPHNLMKAVFNLNFLMYIIYRNNDFSPNLYISKFAQQYCCNANAHTLNLGYLCGINIKSPNVVAMGRLA